MNQLEQQIYAATFAAAFESNWRFLAEHDGVTKAMERTRNGFPYAEVADQAVLAHRNALAGDDSEYLLIVKEGTRPTEEPKTDVARELQAKLDSVRQNSPIVATSYRVFQDDEIIALKQSVVGLFAQNQLLIEQVAAWKQRF